ncbi:septum formation initiator family protein [Paenibacillus sp. MMS18-CY102]|uniref:septum formation initiator family protein n=1 Tax=Paenibacillus sp. MMS18-CY102 TaxID=2682849 RepID=UPI0013654143|nr:septum formation initiator family protein [Paenibacillus sp. MMS18-CY102]MWC27449.1 cell division initiation protein [Paenibacillus sp. MMS18-CY102]
MPYTNGNLALQPKRKHEQQKQVVRETTRTVVTKRTLPMGEKLRYLLTIVGVVLVLFFIVFRYADVYQIKYDTKKMADEQSKLATDIQELQQQVETLKSPDNFKKQAEKLGYSFPADDKGKEITVRKKNTESAQTARN